ncbi:MAG: transporter substrate-binding domain-containing protein [Planctomycetes bacterium]|nr:transporter substrate-binding domain-containing protein [Planctomycetota bacterium]
MRGIRLFSVAAGAALLIAAALATGCASAGKTPDSKHQRGIESLDNREPLKVGVIDLPPYAFRSGGGHWSGLAVTLFHQIAKSSSLKYSFVEFKDMPELVRAIESNSIDLAAIAVDPTPEYELIMNFSNSFDESGTSIVIRKQKSLPFLEMIEQIWQSNIPAFTGIVLLVLCVVGILVGFAERKKNPSHFGGSFLGTIGEGLWWSSSTMSTVGYGDRVPTTRRGRALGGLWMLISFGLMTVLAGMFSSVLTMSQFNSLIRSVNDLAQTRCGAVENSAAYDDGKDLKLAMSPYSTQEDALTALAKGEIGAVLGDTVQMRWILEQPEWKGLAMLPAPLVTLYAAFPISNSVDQRTLDVINFHLLKITDSPEWENIRHLFLGAQHE